MKKIKGILALIIILVAALLGYQYTNNNDRISAELINVADGDTAHFLVNGVDQKVRFLAINAPDEGEDFYKEATDYLEEVLTNATKIELYKDKNADQDKYGRYLYWVFADDELVNGLMVSEGLARVAYTYDDYEFTNLLYSMQDIAKENKVGIWSK